MGRRVSVDAIPVRTEWPGRWVAPSSRWHHTIADQLYFTAVQMGSDVLAFMSADATRNLMSSVCTPRLIRARLFQLALAGSEGAKWSMCRKDTFDFSLSCCCWECIAGIDFTQLYAYNCPKVLKEDAYCKIS